MANIKELALKMQHKRYDHKTLSEHTYLSRRTIDDILSGKKEPSIETSVAIAKALSDTPAEFFKVLEYAGYTFLEGPYDILGQLIVGQHFHDTLDKWNDFLAEHGCSFTIPREYKSYMTHMMQ